MARNVFKMSDLDLTTLEGDGKSTVDPYSSHGAVPPADVKASGVSTGGDKGSDKADTKSEVKDAETTSTPEESKSAAPRRGRPPRSTGKDTDAGN